jgi:hypothetical protein
MTSEDQTDDRQDQSTGDALQMEFFKGYGVGVGREASPHDVNLPMLDREIAETQAQVENWDTLLRNAGPLRRGWLKLTRQIPKDYEREIDLSRLYIQDLQESRNKGVEEKMARDDYQRELVRMRRTMSAEEATAYLEIMLDNGIKPLPELFRRAGRPVPQREIGDTTVPGFANDNLPCDLGPTLNEADFDVDFEPPF